MLKIGDILLCKKSIKDFVETGVCLQMPVESQQRGASGAGAERSARGAPVGFVAPGQPRYGGALATAGFIGSDRIVG